MKLKNELDYKDHVMFTNYGINQIMEEAKARVAQQVLRFVCESCGKKYSRKLMT